METLLTLLFVLCQIERKEKEDQLNGALTDYQSKIEEMTHQLSDYAARTAKCEDQKATALVNLEKLESEKADCLNSQVGVNKERVRSTTISLLIVKKLHCYMKLCY